MPHAQCPMPNTSLREAALRQGSVTTPTTTLTTSAQCSMPNVQ
ncbi:hypothetical protein [Nostoc sp. NMS7]|nr:hypothetical protein [Nostoc sp. NMS7]